jgi:2-hydroxychromene-2-carboxylate isomerase
VDLLMPELTFYFDLGSPYAYLAAERLDSRFPEPVVWQPVLLGGLFRLTGRSSWALGDYRRREWGMAEIEARARSYALPPLRWPDPWPSDYLMAMRATTFAFNTGRGREFTREAYRAAFQRGADLSIPGQVLRVADAAGLDPGLTRDATTEPEIKAGLRTATDAAFERGVFGVPTLAVGDELFWGDDRLEAAAAELARVTLPRGPG